MKCLLCNKIISKNRFTYCSAFCSKKSWYIKHLGGRKSYLVKNPEFWKTTTGIGFKWEIWASKFLKAEHKQFEKGVDLIWGNKTIDVKSANLYKRKNHKGKPVKPEQKGWWCFSRNNKINPDFFFCICLLNNKPLKAYMIPEKEMSKDGAVIGWVSKKFNKYLYKF